jgi:UDP-N-acetylglucosamine:LPS N-acetylglucosamine transferase
VSELSALAVPAVYVPYPHGNGEQELNARPAVVAGAARLVADARLDAAWIDAELQPLLADPATRARMRRAARGIGIVDAADRLAAMVDDAAAGRGRGDEE